MGLILNLETSTKNCSVSLFKNGEMIAVCEEAKEQYQHAEKLHLFIQWCMEAAEVKPKDLEAICVSKGPGSYTGLRIGVSAAKGLCFALGIPLISINSLHVLAQGYKGEADLITPMLDARRQEVYTAIFNHEMTELSPTEALILEANSFDKYAHKKIAFIGDGSTKAKEILNQNHSAEFIYQLPSARHMGKWAEHMFNNNIFEDTAYFEPFYLKDFIAGKTTKK